MTTQPAEKNPSSERKSVLKPWLYGYSSAALPVSAISALGLYLGARIESTLLTCAVIELMPLGAYAGYKAIKELRKGRTDSVVGFTINCALLIGAAAPVVVQWLKHRG